MIQNFQPVSPSDLATLPLYLLSDIADFRPFPLALPPLPHQFTDWGYTLLRLQKVVHRKPVPFRPHASEPDYLLCYCIETLECGHQLHIFPQSDALVAIRRDCKDCGSNLIEFPKSVPSPERKRA